MENAVAIREDFKITAEDVRKYFAPNATEKEFGILMGICNSFKLNPFKREVHFVKYGSAPASIITGYEIYLKRAERTGKLDGWKCWIEKDDMGEKAVIEIKRKDQSMPIRWEVYRKEFDKQQSTWKSMPTFMLKKVAIAQGFRLAFPDDLGGMPYIPEEMPHDKGGGASESLPQEAIIDTPVEDIPVSPEPPVSTDAEKTLPIERPSGVEHEKTPPTMNQYPPKDTLKISDAQRKRFYAIAKGTGFNDDEIKAQLARYGIKHTADILKSEYNEMVEWAEGADKNA
jgi:phage recombination protein Bet